MIQRGSRMDRLKKISKPQWAVVGFIAAIIGVYMAGVIYHHYHFLSNTFIGPVKVAGQSVKGAIEKVNDELKNYPLVLTENGEEFGYIELGQIDAKITDDKVVKEMLVKQNEWAWLFSYFDKHQIDLTQAVDADDELVAGLIGALNIKNEERTPSQNAILQDSGSGHIVVPESYGNQVSVKSLENGLLKSFDEQSNKLALDTAYDLPEITKDSQAIKDLKAHLDVMSQTKITMTFDGNEVTIPQETIASWLYLDNDGKPQVDTKLVQDYILSVNREYAQLFKPHTFNSTYQGQVQVDPGTLGWYIDRFTESEHIAELIQQTGEFTYEPTINGYGYGMHGNIGDSYVEVDLLNQMMLIYVNGELVLDTPIVSGKLGANTIPGAYEVWQKLEDTDLTGFDPTRNREYVQPVDYWIAFDDQLQGIHDASWQPSFGSSNYLSSGSLGCINTPPAVMKTVFEIVPIGMPVLIF